MTRQRVGKIDEDKKQHMPETNIKININHRKLKPIKKEVINQSEEQQISQQTSVEDVMRVKEFFFRFQSKKGKTFDSFCLMKQANPESLILSQFSIYIGNLVGECNDLQKDSTGLEYDYKYDEQNNLHITKRGVEYIRDLLRKEDKYLGLSNNIAINATKYLTLPKIKNSAIEAPSKSKPIMILSVQNMVTNEVTKIEQKKKDQYYPQQVFQETWVKYNQNISSEILQRCEKGHWLSSEIINVYARYKNKENMCKFWGLKVVEEIQNFKRIYVFDVDTIGLLREYFRLRDTEIGQNGFKSIYERCLSIGKYIFDIYDIVFFPLNKKGYHWCLMSCRKLRSKKVIFEVYDSLTNGSDQFYKEFYELIRSFLLKFEIINQLQFDSSILKVVECQRQRNGIDCGVFLCQFIENIDKGLGIGSISEQEIANMRMNLFNLLRQ